MRKYSILPVFWFLLICLLPPNGETCTSFCLGHGDQLVFGKNYDWMVEDGLVVVNKRNVIKTALLNEKEGNDRPARWTSKFGSITFNQYGRELPAGGMNEAGLVVEIMMLPETQYPLADSRPEISSLQWIQYQLDNFSSVDNVIASDSRIRIRPTGGPGSHYFTCDQTGDCATIEFINGKLVYHSNGQLPVKTLTNSTYAESINAWKQKSSLQYSASSSLGRFIRAADRVKAYNPDISNSVIDYAFNILQNVAQGSFTPWSIVYDMRNLRVYFRTFGNKKVRYFDLGAFDFSCTEPVKILDMNAALSADVTANFVDYTYYQNRMLIGNSFRKTDFLQGFPEAVLDTLAHYPDRTACSY